MGKVPVTLLLFRPPLAFLHSLFVLALTFRLYHRQQFSSFQVWISQNFVNRSFIMLFSLTVFRAFESILERIVSSGCLRRSHQGRSQIQSIPGHPSFVGYQGCARVTGDARVPLSQDNYRRDRDLLCTTWEQSFVRTSLDESCVSNDGRFVASGHGATTHGDVFESTQGGVLGSTRG